MSTRIALVLSVLLAVVSAVGVRAWIQQEKVNQALKYERVPILVAKRSIPANSLLKSNMLTGKYVAKNLVTSDMIHYNERIPYINKILTKATPRGQTILRDHIEEPINKLTGGRDVVAEGMRAVSIRVDQSKVAGFLVRPGDYVDILGTFTVTAASKGRAGNPAERTIKTVCLLEGVKVLAVDNRTQQISTRANKLKTDPYRTLTVEVKPTDGARLINAQREGDLYLMLRSRQDGGEKVLKEGTTYRWDQR